MSKQIQLGDKVKDTVSGFTGITVGRTEWLNGCVRFAVQADKCKDGLPTDNQHIDESQLVILKKRVVTPFEGGETKRTGGPRPNPGSFPCAR